jgi:hypothetical protein
MLIPHGVYRDMLSDSGWSEYLLFDDAGRVFLNAARMRKDYEGGGYRAIRSDYVNGSLVFTAVRDMGGLVQVTPADRWYFDLRR